MRTSTDFERDRDLILVPGTITGPSGSVKCSMILDTGASYTTITPDVARRIGYSARDRRNWSTVTTPGGRERGYSHYVERFVALGFRCKHLFVQVAEFDVKSPHRRDDVRADALLGLTFLDHFNYEIRSYESRIFVERAAD